MPGDRAVVAELELHFGKWNAGLRQQHPGAHRPRRVVLVGDDELQLSHGKLLSSASMTTALRRSRRGTDRSERRMMPTGAPSGKPFELHRETVRLRAAVPVRSLPSGRSSPSTVGISSLTVGWMRTCALQRRYRAAGVHGVEQRMHRPRRRRCRGSRRRGCACVSASTWIFRKPCVSPFSTARADAGHRPLADERLMPGLLDLRLAHADAAERRVGEEGVDGDAVAYACGRRC